MRKLYHSIRISVRYRLSIGLLIALMCGTLAVEYLPNEQYGGTSGAKQAAGQPSQPTPAAIDAVASAVSIRPNAKIHPHRSPVAVHAVASAVSASKPPSGDWASFLPQRGGFADGESGITVANVSSLARAWTVHAGGGVSSEPVVVNGVVYWGSWDGYEHATGVDGRQLWATYLGSTTNDHCYPTTAGVAGTATLLSFAVDGRQRLVDFVGGGNAHFYALDAATGKILWATALGSAPGTFIWGSPVVSSGHIYIGTASVGGCPEAQGRFFQLRAATGAIERVLDLVPPGCLGGGVWGSPTLDTQTGELYITTSDADQCDVDEPYAMSVLELHAASLTIAGSWQVPDVEAVENGDFGATPTLFMARLDGVWRGLVGAVNKNGIFYAFRRGDIGAGPIWQDHMSTALNGCGRCPSGDEAAAAWDGTHLYVGSTSTSIDGTFCYGSVRELDPATGSYLWQHCLSQGYRVMAPLILVPGLVVAGAGPTFFVLDASSGKVLFEYSDRSQNSTFDGAATLTGATLYTGNLDGTLFAFKPPQQPD